MSNLFIALPLVTQRFLSLRRVQLMQQWNMDKPVCLKHSNDGINHVDHRLNTESRNRKLEREAESGKSWSKVQTESRKHPKNAMRSVARRHTGTRNGNGKRNCELKPRTEDLRFIRGYNNTVHPSQLCWTYLEHKYLFRDRGIAIHAGYALIYLWQIFQ